MKIFRFLLLYTALSSFFLFSYIFFPLSLSGQPSIIETIQGVLPSLVEVTAENFGAVSSPQTTAAIDKNTGRLFVLRPVKTAYWKKSGAGVIIDASGLIVTNFHTIAKANRISVTLHNNTNLSAKIVRMFPQEDFVLLKIESPIPFIPIPFADSNTIRLGEKIFTIGHSHLLDQTISEGKIIGIGTSQSKNPNNTDADIIQVNLNIYRGDSGGPLLDHRGALIGLMVAAQIQKDRSSFAIASNKIKKRYLEYLSSSKNKK